MGIGKAARPPTQNETSDILVTSFTARATGCIVGDVSTGEKEHQSQRDIILRDDVLTTGATFRACRDACERAGTSCTGGFGWHGLGGCRGTFGMWRMASPLICPYLAERINALIDPLNALIQGETSGWANLSNASSALHTITEWHWVGFYLVDRQTTIWC